MESILIALLSFILGVLLAPAVLFLRVRRADNVDNSNLTNIYRVFAYIATHPGNLAKMVILKEGFRLSKSGFAFKPFWYMGSDEFKDVVETVD